jgi:hypothetical protein
MNKTILFALLASSTAALAFTGCSSSSSNETGGDASPDVTTSDSPSGDDSSANDSATADTGTSDAGVDAPFVPPAPPTLGAQIDRMGRPAINTALNHTFDPTCVNTSATSSCAPKDAYNQDSNPANWSVPPATDGGTVPGYFTQFFGNLAIYDALDGVCGNQAGFGALGAPAYSALATVLSQDALFVNTGSTTCGQYLGVELNALGVTNTDCGGRTPSENTIDVTYSLLSGAFSVSDAGVPSFPVTNGITAPASAPSSTFPYFATPHP